MVKSLKASSISCYSFDAIKMSCRTQILATACFPIIRTGTDDAAVRLIATHSHTWFPLYNEKGKPMS